MITKPIKPPRKQILGHTSNTRPKAGQRIMFKVLNAAGGMRWVHGHYEMPTNRYVRPARWFRGHTYWSAKDVLEWRPLPPKT